MIHFKFNNMEELLNSASNISWDVFLSKVIDLGTSFGSRIIAAVIILIIGRWLIRKINRLVATILEKGMQKLLCLLLSRA